MSFQLIEGVVLSEAALEGVKSAYSVSGDNMIDSVLSAELIRPLLERGAKLLPEPHFFFLELPCTEDEEKSLRKSKSDPTHYKVYYLDNCTEPVTQALLKRYGDLLINDGLTRFGFGSNQTSEEIYVLDYQQVQIYADDGRFVPLFEELGAERVKTVITPWDNFTPDNAGVSLAVETEGETTDMIPVNLAEEGMYLAETRSN